MNISEDELFNLVTKQQQQKAEPKKKSTTGGIGLPKESTHGKLPPVVTPANAAAM
jgi:hypothetical protein